MNSRFSSSSEVFAWLSRFINYESGMIPPKIFRLETMEALAELAGNPQHCAPVIHIAGSKGKGSVTGMIASMLEADGRRTARFMSPHISDFRERICLGNVFFDEPVYCTAGDELRDLAENNVPACGYSIFDPEKGGDVPSFFELLTIYFFLCARAGSCDVMVVETGMGGRLDATNIVDPLVSVITLIELEHTAFLGNTIAAVAGEKAGIIKQGRPLVLARQCAEAKEVFIKRAAEKNSPLLYFPDIAAVENPKIHSGGTDFSLIILPAPTQHQNINCRVGAGLELSIPIPGKVQAENAALAVVALKKAFPDIGDKALQLGLKQVNIPARFEKINAAVNGKCILPVIIDGAHTPESASLCADTFCSLYGEGGVLIFGCAADKNAAGMAQVLLPRFSHIIITMPGTFKVSNPEKIYHVFSMQAVPEKGKILNIKDTGEAIRHALDTALENNLPVLCMGSFYLASEVRALLDYHL
ncbi:MAG: Mur ligase family protein [Treponema sp.]|nr:Mur ligase family protein [Treponema sp.]